jgi:error-prone DNA polymerase
LVEQYRKEVMRSQLMTVYGTWQRDAQTGGQVMNLLAMRVVDHSEMLGSLLTKSRDFR